MLKVVLHPSAFRFLGNIDKEIQKRIKSKLIELSELPEQRGKHLRHVNMWSLRIDDYRAIYEISKAEKKIFVLFIGHRDDVYDDFSKAYP